MTALGEARRDQIMQFITREVADTGHFPSFREISRRCTIPLSVLAHHIDILVRRGLLRKHYPYGSRYATYLIAGKEDDDRQLLDLARQLAYGGMTTDEEDAIITKMRQIARWTRTEE